MLEKGHDFSLQYLIDKMTLIGWMGSLLYLFFFSDVPSKFRILHKQKRKESLGEDMPSSVKLQCIFPSNPQNTHLRCKFINNLDFIEKGLKRSSGINFIIYFFFLLLQSMFYFSLLVNRLESRKVFLRYSY